MHSGSRSYFDLLRLSLLPDLSQSVSDALRCWHVYRCFSTRYFCYNCCPYCGSFALKSADCYKNDSCYSGCECYYRNASVWYSVESCCGYNSGYD